MLLTLIFLQVQRLALLATIDIYFDGEESMPTEGLDINARPMEVRHENQTGN